MNRPERNFTTEDIRLERRLPSYWRVAFDMPPVNIFGPKQLRAGDIENRLGFHVGQIGD